MSNIHPSAVIEDGAQIDPTAQVGPFCVVGPEVILGCVLLLKHLQVAGGALFRPLVSVFDERFELLFVRGGVGFFQCQH